MNFLFITKEYPPIPDASGRIVYILTQELKKQGHRVDVIARDINEHITDGENGDVYWLKISAWERLCKRVNSADCKRIYKYIYFVATYVRKLVMMLNIRHFPNVEMPITKRTVKLFDKKLSHIKYDTVISFFRPYSCLEAAVEISQRDNVLGLVSCYFDLVEDASCPKLMPLKLYRELIQKGDEFIFEESDAVMLPRSAMTADKQLYRNYADKITYYDFPTFITGEGSVNNISEASDDNTVRLVFAGKLATEFRNPKRMLDILNAVAAKTPHISYELDMFGGGDCIDMVKEYSSVDNFHIRHHGVVQKDKVTEYEARADFLVNIMNYYSSLVPSKIFELFATAKPILNIMTRGDDGSLEFFEKYPAVYTAHVNTDDGIAADNILQFIGEHRNYRGDLQEIQEIYKTCTPEYVAEQIIGLAENISKK